MLLYFIPFGQYLVVSYCQDLSVVNSAVRQMVVSLLWTLLKPVIK